MTMKKRVNLCSFLPEGIIIQIIKGLDLKHMIKCMRVCKQWRNLISELISDDPLLSKGLIISLIITPSRLDLKSMIKCMLVCKQWRNLISDLISDNPLLGAKGYVKFLGYDFGPTQEIVWMKKLSTDGHIIMTSCHHRRYSLYSSDPRNKLVIHHRYPGELHAFDYKPTLLSPEKLMQKNGQE